LIDGRHFSDVIDVMARRGANIDSNHMLVVIKLRAKICRVSNTKPQQLRRFAVDRLKDRDVASRYYDELKSELQGVQVQPLSLDEKRTTSGYVSSQERVTINQQKLSAGVIEEHFEEHLNEGSKSEQPTRPVNLPRK
jgi:hypothetical protein